jgi:multidrug efflux system membrane fusion protein
MFKGWRRVTVAAAVVATAAGAQLSFGQNAPQAPATSRPASPGKDGPVPGPSDKGARPAAPVSAAVATAGNMPIVLTAPGTVEPLATVAVRSRVDGQIVAVKFKEGDAVAANEVLFELDDRLIRAQIRQAEAMIAKDRAALVDAESILARRETLARQKIVTEAATETQRQTVEGLKAAITLSQAQLEAQKTQLDYLVIRAPIAGRTGSVTAKLGATVRASDANALVTINQTKPITVTFALPQSELEALKRALAAKAAAEVRVPGQRGTPIAATLSFLDNQIDRTTGTVTAKVEAPNPEERLWPGQSVEVALTVETRPNVVSVPASAVLPSATGMITWVIGPENRVTIKPVTVARIVGQFAYLQNGVAAGDRVVTDGQIRLQPGAPVSIVEPGARSEGRPRDAAKAAP